MSQILDVLFFKTSNGQFSVFVDNEDTGYRIVNGSLGCSGQGNNEYGVYKIIAGEAGQIMWVGSLQKAKKTVLFWLNRKEQ